MLQAVGYNTEGKGLDLCLSFLCGLPVCENPRQTHDLHGELVGWVHLPGFLLTSRSVVV